MMARGARCCCVMCQAVPAAGAQWISGRSFALLRALNVYTIGVTEGMDTGTRQCGKALLCIDRFSECATDIMHGDAATG
jgi:hypothetical protein